MSNQVNTYSPDYAVHPGEILDEYLESKTLKKSEFARLTGLTEKTINQIIHGKAPVTAQTALKFERVLNVSAELWNNLEANYRLYNAKIEDQKKLQSYIDWSKKFPLNQLIKRKYLSNTKNSVEKIDSLLNFFGVASPELWNIKYNSTSFALHESNTFKSEMESLYTWMRIGELEAHQSNCSEYSDKKFLNSLFKIRKLTNEPPEIFEPEMVKLCSEAGVHLSFVKEFPKTHLSGMALWINPKKALIILSLRHKTNDHFWFTFFHEAGHILKHNKRFKSKFFIDENKMENSKLEDEANKFASNFLISNSTFRDYFFNLNKIIKNDIIKFSKKEKIAPGIVVGRLQHFKLINYNQYNDLKIKFEFRE